MPTSEHTIWWSHTRDQALSHCPRSYYYRYYAGQPYEHTPAPASDARAVALRRLLTLDLVLGTELHNRAREIATSICRGRSIPHSNTLRTRTRAALASAWRQRNVEAFVRNPFRHPMLLTSYYGRETSTRELERIRRKLRDCHDNLVNSPIWAEVADAASDHVFTVDSIRSFTVDGTRVLAAPDLVYQCGTTTTIVDWKSGPDHRAQRQLGLYAVFVRDVLRVPFVEGAYKARVVDLGCGEESSWHLTSADLAAAELRISNGALRMRAYLQEPTLGIPRPKQDFELARQRWRCPLCPFWELCADELRSTTARTGTASSAAPPLR